MRSFTSPLTTLKTSNMNMNKLAFLFKDAFTISGLLIIRITAVTIAVIVGLRILSLLAGDITLGSFLDI